MNTIIMKITGYDEQSGSLLVSFASDTTQSQNPEDYPSLAYQPYTMWPNVTDVTQIPKLLAQAGIWQVESQEKKEALALDENTKAAYNALVGQQLTFNLSDLTTN